MEIIKKIEENRLYDDLQENPFLIEMKDHLNSSELYDQVWTGQRAKVRIDFIRKMFIYENKGEICCEIRYDGSSALGNSGKGITKAIPPDMLKPIIRMIKIQNILR